MAAPPVAAPLPLPRLFQSTTAPTTSVPTSASTRTSHSHDVIYLDDSDGEVKEQPPTVVPMQLDSDDGDVRVIHSTIAAPMVAGRVGGAGSGSGGGSTGASGSTTPRNGYSLVSSIKEKLFGWNNNNNGNNINHSQPTTATFGHTLSHPAHNHTLSSSSSDSSASASCGAFSLCSPSSASASPVMKRQRSNDDMGVAPSESAAAPAPVTSTAATPPVPPPHPNFRISALHNKSTTPSPTPPPIPPLPPPTPPALSTSASSSSSPTPPLISHTASTSLSTAMSDEELARFLQAEDEAADRRQRQQRQQAEEAAFLQFQREQGTCVLCRTEVGSELTLELPECGHRMCADCLRAHLLQWNGSGSVTCPCSSSAGRCSVIVPERMMRQVLTAEQLDEVQQRQMKAFLSASSSSYVTCPQCHETFEAIAASTSTTTPSPRVSTATATAGKETAEDGRELTAEQVEHRNKHRFRCVSCSGNFCRLCQITPYHLGYTCDEYQRYTNAPHCRYCEDVLLDPATATTSASSSTAASASSSSSASTSFVARILRSNSKKEDLVQPTKPANVCSKTECIDKYNNQCIKLLPVCRHPCDGIRGERHCLPCMYDGCERHKPDTQTRDEFCAVCYADELGQAPCIQLKCGHIFHQACIKTKLDKRWPTPRVTFYFMSCPLCNAQIDHPALTPTLAPLVALRQQVQQKASDRLSFEGNQNDQALQKGGKYESRPADYAMDLYAYYICSHCHQPYFGGRRQCEEAAAARGEENYNENDLVCGGCVMTEGGGNGCAKHGKEFIEYKFCWGNTHFCADCHKRQEQGEYLTRKRLDELPQCDGVKCPLGVKHPPNGTEFALGCGICRQRQTF